MLRYHSVVRELWVEVHSIHDVMDDSFDGGYCCGRLATNWRLLWWVVCAAAAAALLCYLPLVVWSSGCEMRIIRPHRTRVRSSSSSVFIGRACTLIRAGQFLSSRHSRTNCLLLLVVVAVVVLSTQLHQYTQYPS